jgi:hypothetical protein
MRRSVPAMPRMRARARARISEKLIADLATVWEEPGQSVRTPGNLDPDEWAILRRVIELIKQNASGAELGPMLETIENALRADKQSRSPAERGAAGRGIPADDPPPTACAPRIAAADVIQQPIVRAVSIKGTNLWIC